MIMTGLRPTGHKLKNHAARICLQREFAFRSYLRLRYGAKTPVKAPKISFENGALRNRDEWLAATRLVRDLRLVPHPDSPKNWDTVAALATILKSTNPDAWVLDAGAELSSALLPCLYLYGYRNLTGINLIFQKPQRRGSIAYEFGDITNTRFRSEQFDAITCLSVIEHGVDLQAYFREMSRILRPGGLLMDSNGLKFWSQNWSALSGLEYESQSHVLRLANQRSAPVWPASESVAIAFLDSAPGSSDQFGTRAYLSTLGTVMGTGVASDSVPLFKPAPGETITDITIGYDGLLYLALAGGVGIIDLLGRSDIVKAAFPKELPFSAWRLAASPSEGLAFTSQ